MPAYKGWVLSTAWQGGEENVQTCGEQDNWPGGGEVVVKKSKRTWYLCDEKMKKRGGQTQLCFTPVRATQSTNKSVGGGRRDNLELLNDFSSSTAGQRMGQSTSAAGMDR